MQPNAEEDLISENGISLSTAYRRWCEISIRDWAEILAEFSDANRPMVSDGMSSAGLWWGRLDRRKNQDMAWPKIGRAQRTAASTMREALAVGDLVAHIRDPNTGEILTPSVWSADNLQNFWRGKTTEDASLPLEGDFVSPDDPDSPGPWAQINGRRRRLFIKKQAFELWSCIKENCDLAIPSQGNERLVVAASPKGTVETITLKVADTQKSRALAQSIEEVFSPGGVPVGTLLAHVKRRLEDSAHFKRAGLEFKSLKDGSYDTSLKRMLGMIKS
jgi:hypothetical protein